MQLLRELESNIVRRDEWQIETRIYLPLLETDVSFIVEPESNQTEITAAHIGALNRLIVVPAGRIHEIKSQLLEHFQEYEHFYTCLLYTSPSPRDS